jgi:DNA-binding transcriptional LysR family regulator
MTNSGTAIAESCARGGGIGILPSYMAVARSVASCRSTCRRLAPVKFWINYTERVRRSPQGKLLIDWLRKLFDMPEAIWFAEEFVHPRDYLEKVRELRPQMRRDK